MPRLFFVASLCVAFAAPALADDTAETAPTADGVRAVEAHWTRAFLGGDEAYLDKLLDDDYVSVNQKGVARPKSAIIALAKKIAAAPNPPPATPPPLNIVVHGSAAIVTSSNATDVSVDVFHYENGAWHAWYSQHTAVSPG
jgi:Domain of unknown function (DUF4440)